MTFASQLILTTENLCSINWKVGIFLDRDAMNFQTSDISLAAFLIMKGKKLVSVSRERGKFEFIFEPFTLDEGDLEQVYVRSEFPQYDAAMRQLKRKLYGP